MNRDFLRDLLSAPHRRRSCRHLHIEQDRGEIVLEERISKLLHPSSLKRDLAEGLENGFESEQVLGTASTSSILNALVGCHRANLFIRAPSA